jgi:hypothetical protein
MQSILKELQNKRETKATSNDIIKEFESAMESDMDTPSALETLIRSGKSGETKKIAAALGFAF